jgi:hypothetical protein
LRINAKVLDEAILVAAGISTITEGLIAFLAQGDVISQAGQRSAAACAPPVLRLISVGAAKFHQDLQRFEHIEQLPVDCGSRGVGAICTSRWAPNALAYVLFVVVSGGIKPFDGRSVTPAVQWSKPDAWHPTGGYGTGEKGWNADSERVDGVVHHQGQRVPRQIGRGW